MTRTLKIAFRLKNAYRVNSVIYVLKQVPLINKILPSSLYQSKGLKVFAQIISALIEIGSVFVGKIIYLSLLIGIPISLYKYSNQVDLYSHLIFVLTIVGMMLNTSMFNPEKHKYYGIVLMRMDAKKYTLASYGYYLLKIIVGFMPFSILFVFLKGVPLMFGIMMPFCIAAGKVIATTYFLHQYEKTGIIKNENNPSKGMWILIVGLLTLAYLAPAINLVIPGFLSRGLMMLMIPIGLVSLRKILTFDYYMEVNKGILYDSMKQMDDIQNIQKDLNQKNISDMSITSDKKGLEFLNELFVKRHKKILWQATKRLTLIVIGIVAVMSVIMIVRPETKELVNMAIFNILPPITFIMYAFNRGKSYTSALFMNCDHSMLTYPFFKNGSSILQLFRLRLMDLMRLNFIMAVAIGAGLCWLLWFSGGSKDVSDYPIIFITVIAMSLFFSIHYLTMYYLLQPYNAETEIKSGMYMAMSGITYFLCYMQIYLHISLKLYGALWIGFTILYSSIASILVYKFAPKTFRIR